MKLRRVKTILEQTRQYLVQRLLPFWIERSPDVELGGFLTHFDRDGKPTGVTDKTLLMQIRMLYTMASAHRAGYGDGRCAELAAAGAEFLLEHYLDDRDGGWFWSADRRGSPTDLRKIGYGQCFAMYAFGEYYLATGDRSGRDAVQHTFDVVMEKMADPLHGGYFEIMNRDWSPTAPGRHGGDRKSFDVHMHMMEALTKVVDVVGEADGCSETHEADGGGITDAGTARQKLRDVIEILTGKMLDPEHGTAVQQFSLDFGPLPAIRFDVAWGTDEDPASGSIPIEITSYGHNVEFAWLLLLAADALGDRREVYSPIVRRMCDHCLELGIDEEHGGVYIDGPAGGSASEAHSNHKKQFWQQAEVLVGMLAACDLFDDDRYWDAFLNVHEFVFAKFVNWDGGGEWYHLLDREGHPLQDYLADH